ncbi:MAG: NUDIX domain-containing protein [Candidatus Paceibacterales bacterium]
MKEEYFDVVNEEDEIIGRAKRSECHKKNLIHRAVIVFIFNDEEKLLLQKRSEFKDLYKGCWASSVGGHLDLGESYSEAVKRELKEELGIELPLEQSFFIKIRRKIDSENVRLFTGKNNGPFDFNKREIERVDFFSPTEIKKMIKKGETFTPTFLAAFKTYLERESLK